MRYTFTYITENLLNNKRYIGVHSTFDLNDGYYGSGTYIKMAVKKYGIECFKTTPIEFFNNMEDAYVSESKLVTEEWIQNPSTYNVALGGNGGNLASWETKQKMSESHSGVNNSMYGKVHSTKTKKLISELAKKLQTGKYTRTEFTIKRLSESSKKRIYSDEIKAQMSKGQLKIKPLTCPHCGRVGTHNMTRYHFDKCKLVSPPIDRHKTPTWKGIIVVEDLIGHETEYDSMADASREMKVDQHGISNHIKNSTTFKRGIYKGWKFKLKEVE